MKDDEIFSAPDEPSPIGVELEARVVAWVAGEASEFEEAELQRLCAEKPELLHFKQRIEAVQRYVADATRTEEPPLRMNEGQRSKLLARLRSADTPARIIVPGPARVLPHGNQGRKPRRIRWWMLATAACLPLAGLLFLTLAGGRAEKAIRPIAATRPSAPTTDSVVRLDAFEVRSESKLSRVLGEAKRRIFPTAETTAGERAAQRTASASPELPSAVSGSALPPNATADDMKDAFKSAEKKPSPAVSPRLGYDSIGGNFGDAAGKALSPAANGLGLADGPKMQAQGAIALSMPSLTPRPVEKPSGVTEAASLNLPVFRSPPPAAENTRSERQDANEVTVTTNGLLFGSSSFIAPAIDPWKRDTEQAKRDTAPVPLARPSAAPASNAETSTAAESVSTFSLHVSDVSFRLAAAALARGRMPEVSTVRPEEFYNAFDYGDPAPGVAEKIGCRIEQAAHPFLQQRNLVRIALKVAATGRAAQTPLQLTVLLDTSGSMEREDRAATVRRAMEVLASLLGPADRVTLIGFARQPRLLAENIPGDRGRELIDLAAHTPAEGGTNLEEALKLASELARRHRTPTAQNRIVVLTDGAANLGNADPDALARLVETLRKAGIAFDACGVGLDGLDDTVLEALTRKGDGRYYVLNSPDAADTGFARQLAGAFRPAAENVKVQVRFNPARVASYRLIGFEEHRLREEDFRNDKIDAAELAADEAGVALYQIEPLPQGDGELGEVSIRFRDAATGAVAERSWTMPYDARAAAFDRASPSLQLAGVAALLAEKLRGGAPAEPIPLRELAPVVSALESHYRGNARAQELVAAFKNLRRLTGE